MTKLSLSIQNVKLAKEVIFESLNLPLSMLQLTIISFVINNATNLHHYKYVFFVLVHIHNKTTHNSPQLPIASHDAVMFTICSSCKPAKTRSILSV